MNLNFIVLSWRLTVWLFDVLTGQMKKSYVKSIRRLVRPSNSFESEGRIATFKTTQNMKPIPLYTFLGGVWQSRPYY